ncbi:hypothetical protein PGT21_035374 [Puccinia graminis f. sp. tritici]|uniref:Uncharacterized protein n=1 Tax=Puccinia graminis f. sp. tritici TaxID=56615 RepID=A0A5B0R313_PUCGR|nr:hypothetical protein PGT21_035374 [Puccinia graminis f. sp. tritici]
MTSYHAIDSLILADDLPPPSIADGKIDAGGPSLYSVLFVIYFNRSRPLLLSAFLLNNSTHYDLPARFQTRAAPKENDETTCRYILLYTDLLTLIMTQTTRFNASDLGSFSFPLPQRYNDHPLPLTIGIPKMTCFLCPYRHNLSS